MPIQVWIIGGLLIAAGVGGALYWTYDAGGDAREGAIKTEVQSETIRATEAAREAKERADADVRAMPYDKKVEGLGK